MKLSQSTLMYSKPYTKRINNLRMSMYYKSRKFQSFDGKGNPKQHVAHFFETYNNAGIKGDPRWLYNLFNPSKGMFFIIGTSTLHSNALIIETK